MATSLFPSQDGPVTALVRSASVASALNSGALVASAVTALSGAMTSGVLKTGLSVTGRGRINWLAFYTNDATSRTLRVKITLDGAEIYDLTSAAISASGTGLTPIGAYASGGPPTFQPVQFNQSLLIEIASSVTETDKATLAYNYEVWA